MRSLLAVRRTRRLTRRHLVFSVAALSLVTVPGKSEAANRPPVKILAFGDSLTAGYGLPHEQGFVARLQAALDARHANITVLDGGVSGDTSTDALTRLDWVMGDNPDAVIVELGGNDGLRGLDPQIMGRNIDQILDRIVKAGKPVLLSGMVAPPNMGADYSSKFRAVFGDLSKRRDILWDPFFLDGVAGHPDLEQADHIHPNARGVDVIVARLLPRVMELASHTGVGIRYPK